jgi:hypothetical protein
MRRSSSDGRYLTSNSQCVKRGAHEPITNRQICCEAGADPAPLELTISSNGSGVVCIVIGAEQMISS